MMLICVLSVSFVCLSNQQAATAQAPAVASFTAFFEKLAIAETGLQMDRGDIILSKDKRRARRKFVSDISAERTLLDDYGKSGLKALDTDTATAKSAANLQPKLADLGSDLEGLIRLEESQPSGLSQTVERKAWSAHERAFVGVLLASMKVPSFSMKSLSGPVAYNLSPLLYQGSESAIFAESSLPDRVVVGRTFGGAESVVLRGDEILAYRAEDEADWTPVKSWRDFLKTPKDSGEEDHKSEITLRLRRGRSTKEVKVGYVASLIDVD